MADRQHTLLAHDRELSRRGDLVLAGVDEAGRGAWAGPVVAAAVVLPADCDLPGLDDSKRLSGSRREILLKAILASAPAWGACAVSPACIDRINILQATLEAMARAVARLRMRPDLVLVDGNRSPELPVPSRTLVGGDGRSACVAAASVIAKVLRDRVMTAWDRHHPGYGFAAHKGYGARSHREALQRLGPCSQHRLSYKPLVELDQGRLFR